VSRRLLALATLALAAALALGLLLFDRPERVRVTSLAAPPDTTGAVWFEIRSTCRKNFLRLSAVAPAVVCTTEIADAGTLAPAADGTLPIARTLELPAAGGRTRRLLPFWRERTFELVAYGEWGAGVFTNRARRFLDPWSPTEGAPALALDPRTAHDFVPEADRRAYALSALGSAAHTLYELPPALRAEVRPFVDGATQLLDRALADPALSADVRQLLEADRARFDGVATFWAADGG
jgi:hypothetical protein